MVEATRWDSHLACIRGRAGLTTLSAERMRAEILKLLVAEGAVEALVAMEDGGLLLTILGGVAYRGPLAAMIVAERAAGTCAGSDPPARGACGIGYRRCAAGCAAIAALQCRGETTGPMGHRWWRLGSVDEATARRRISGLGRPRFRDG